MSSQAHKHSNSVSQNHKAQLANAYNELGKELSSSKIKVVGNYTLGKAIGEGTYGKVRLGTHRLTSTRVAIKQIPKAMSASLTREIHHHRRLHHPHVAQLYEVIATETSIWLVTELCSGGELFDYLAEKGRLSEDEAKTVFGQLCLAVGYIHDKGVVHRDLKLENVLLDERCRVKLGDFGFTREYDRMSFLETFCGTTGYASPEMLQGKKYLGPEVDVWSLGVILYCLLTGTLPFDDDDEMRMRDMIIVGTYEDPEWLSLDARDLIRGILQQDPAKRLTIPQILAHKWFSRTTHNESTSSLGATAPPPPLPIAIAEVPSTNPSDSSSTANSPSSFHSASSRLSNSAPTTPDDISQEPLVQHRNTSESTLTKMLPPVQGKAARPPAAIDEENFFASAEPLPSRPTSFVCASSGGSKAPSSFPTRTPARTKRRSVSSVLSQPSSPMSETSLPMPLAPQDYASLLNTPAPLLFSTPLERSLLNNLSSLGFDTGQMVHSVLSDACDSSGAVWWMLKRRAEKKAMEESLRAALTVVVPGTHHASSNVDLESKQPSVRSPSPPDSPSPAATPQHQPINDIPSARSAPQLSFVPPTPTMTSAQRPITPPQRSKSPRSLLSATPTTTESMSKSTPSTPGSSLRESGGSRGRNGKPRSGSVSIMQRATTALEAAGLVRKKSAEVVRDDKERKEGSDERDRDRRPLTVVDQRGLYGPVTSNRLTKSPPATKAKDNARPTTPEHELAASALQTASPWVIPPVRSPHLEVPTPTNSPGDTITALPLFSASGKLAGPVRNRGSLLSTFRMWFNEDRKGKRKASASMSAPSNVQNHGLGNPPSPANGRNRRNTDSRRGNAAGGNPKHRQKRPSVSSRRSSSVNSRRSSVASIHMVVLESPLQNVDEMPFISRQRSDPSRRSFTPNSEAERGEEPSRPSSIHSYSMRTRHKKSPSTSSAGSAAHRGASPLQKYHRRAGSGSSTRVVRQTKQATPSRGWHVRSNSTASSVHSLHSSRPGSLYDVSENEGQRTSSPLQSTHFQNALDETPRRGGSHVKVLVAHKKTTPFMSPAGGSGYLSSYSRSSWKKAWGTEPPGWQSRPTQLPVEVLVISPSGDQPTSLRDVFSGRQSLSLGDEDDWVDEDDETPAFAGGLGQTPTSTSTSSIPSGVYKPKQHETPMALAPAPRVKSGRGAKRDVRVGDTLIAPANALGGGRSGGRTKPGQSPVATNTPLPNDVGFDTSITSDTRVGRRQLPAGRSGPAFRGIQEEDEDEE